MMLYIKDTGFVKEMKLQQETGWLIQKAVFWWLRKKLEITDEPVKVYNFLKPPLKIWICKLPVTSKRVITENIVRMIILLTIKV